MDLFLVTFGLGANLIVAVAVRCGWMEDTAEKASDLEEAATLSTVFDVD